MHKTYNSYWYLRSYLYSITKNVSKLNHCIIHVVTIGIIEQMEGLCMNSSFNLSDSLTYQCQSKSHIMLYTII